MPDVDCNLIECRFNRGGQCTNDKIELNYNATCISYEERDTGEVR